MYFTGEVTAEELRQRLDGAKERVSSQPRAEQRLQTADSVEQQGSSGEGEERGAGGRRGAGRDISIWPFPNLACITYDVVWFGLINQQTKE